MNGLFEKTFSHVLLTLVCSSNFYEAWKVLPEDRSKEERSVRLGRAAGEDLHGHRDEVQESASSAAAAANKI